MVQDIHVLETLAAVVVTLVGSTWLTLAIWDEFFHVVTALLILGACRVQPASPLFLGTVVGSVLIDIDHLPAELGVTLLGDQVHRPVSHSMTTIAVLLILSALVRGRNRLLLFGVAFGIGTHLFRDMATGGVILWWPLTSAIVTIPYHYYALTMAGMLCLSLVTIVGRRASIAAWLQRGLRPPGQSPAVDIW
jgi:hypothetical protein